MSRASLPFPVLLCCLLVASCGDGTGPGAGEPAALSRASGDNQLGTVGEELSAPLTVHVTDAGGRAVPEVGIEFTVVEGSGSVSEPSMTLAGPVGSGAAGAPLETVFTDGAGNASVIWTLGSSPGSQSVSAEIIGSELDPVTFSATAETGPPATLSAPGTYAGAAGEPLVGPLAVTVLDVFGNGVAGVTVTWELSSGSGTLQQTTTQSDGTGRATNQFTLGAGVGLSEITVSAAGLQITVDVVGMTLTNDAVGDNTPASGGFNSVDITKFGGLTIAGELVVYVEFADPVFNIVSGSPNSVAGFVDIDTDQNSNTGFSSSIDKFDLGPSGLGVEHIIFFFADDAGRFPVGRQITDSTAAVTAFVPPVFNENSVTVAVPLDPGLDGDDGAVNMATLLGSPQEPTDLAPNQGHITVTPTGSTATSPATLGQSLHPRLDGERWHGIRIPRLQY